MIEVLVALLIFMIGTLGLVGLQAALTRAQTDSKFRADATYLADEVIGRMWSDIADIAAYSGTNCSAKVNCKEWQSKVASSLPSGVGAIAVDATTGDTTITVTWTMPSGETHHYATQTTIHQS